MITPTASDMESILVTGGTGFLEMHVCDFCAGLGLNVTALSASQPRYSNREALIDTYDWYREQGTDVDETVAIGNRTPREQLALRPFKRVLQLV